MNYSELKIYAMQNNLSEYIHNCKISNELSNFLPEIAVMDKYEQNTYHHPEGNVYEHTMLALKYHENKKRNNYLVLLAILFHDIGKITSQSIDNKGDIHYYSHEKNGLDVFRNIAERLGFPDEDRDIVLYCISQHMRFYKILEFAKLKKVIDLIFSPYFEVLRDVCEADAVSNMHLLEYDDKKTKIVLEFVDKMHYYQNDIQKLYECRKKYKKKYKEL